MQRKVSARPGTKRGKAKTSKRTSARSTKPTAKTKATAAPKITFRSRTADDDAYLVQLTQEQLGSIHEQSFQEPFPADQFLRYLQSGAPTYVVERNGKRIGYYSYLLGSEGTMHISAMVIEPQHQSEGIGTNVMKRIEEDARHRGIQVLEVFVQSSNEQSLAFTRKLGFVEAYQVTPTTICFRKTLVPVGQPQPWPQGATMPMAPNQPYQGY